MDDPGEMSSSRILKRYAHTASRSTPFMETRRDGFDSPTPALSLRLSAGPEGILIFAALPHDDEPLDADDAGGAQDGEILPGE